MTAEATREGEAPMANTCDVLVVGAGPAGLAAAATLAATGLAVVLADQGIRPGGAFHCQPAVGEGSPLVSRRAQQQWRRLRASLNQSSNLTLRTRTVFLGIDSDGVAMLDDRARGSLVLLRPRAVILATGAVERIRPRPGWHLPGVMTAGGLQVMLKQTGRGPTGRVLLAGNGPLLVALAAQLVRLGTPPVAVLESADPFAAPFALAQLLRNPRIVAEAVTNLARMTFVGLHWQTGNRLKAIEVQGTALKATIEHRGRTSVIEADTIVLHDGIRPNDFGLTTSAPMPVCVAGDGRSVLGWVAAEADGRRAAGDVLVALGLPRPAGDDDLAILAREAHAQAALARIFATPPMPAADLPDETILCRCENRTIGDLRALLDTVPELTPREIKLNGRFAMGACQGRFCADSVAELLALPEFRRAGSKATIPLASDLTGTHWPVRPVSVAALIADPIMPDPARPQGE